MRHFRTRAILIAALAPMAAFAATFQWTGAAQPKQTVEIRNVIGDIKAETATGSEVEISVRVVGTRPDPDTIRIDVVQHDGGILVCTIYQGLSRPESCTPDKTPSVTLTNTDVRVHYAVRIPADVRLVARTVNGNVTVDLADSPVSVNTVNGKVVLSSNRPADVHVVNGSIVASLGAVDWADSHEFSSVNGAVDLELPTDCNATVRATTTFGPIMTDFALSVHRALIGSWVYGDINAGGPLLFMSTVNGSIHLRRAQ